MSIHIIKGDKVIVSYDQEAAFWGFMPWVALWEGYDGAPIDHETSSQCPVGYGRSEQEALDDLMEKSEWV